MSGNTRTLVIIIVCALITFAERLLPFVLFSGKKVPPVINYLGKVLPMAVISALVVYCLKNTSFSSLSAFVPGLTAAAVTCLLHLWKRNSLLSIAGGTACYMLLLRILV